MLLLNSRVEQLEVHGARGRGRPGGRPRVGRLGRSGDALRPLRARGSARARHGAGSRVVTGPAVGRGRSAPLGATVEPGGVNFSVFSKSADRVELLLFDREDAARADPGHPAGSDRPPHLPLLARLRARASRRASSTAIAPTVPSRPSAACASTRASCCSTPTPWRSPCPTGYSRDAARATGRQHRDGDEERGRRSAAPTTGRGTRRSSAPGAETVIYELHVRGFTRHPSSGVAPGKARHLRRARREDPLPARSRRHGGRAAARVPVRRAGCAPRARPTTGATPRSRSSRRTAAYSSRQRSARARSTSSATWSRRSTAPASR